jgi:hypothetical protein
MKRLIACSFTALIVLIAVSVGCNKSFDEPSALSRAELTAIAEPDFELTLPPGWVGGLKKKGIYKYRTLSMKEVIHVNVMTVRWVDLKFSMDEYTDLRHKILRKKFGASLVLEPGEIKIQTDQAEYRDSGKGKSITATTFANRTLATRNKLVFATYYNYSGGILGRAVKALDTLTLR